MLMTPNWSSRFLNLKHREQHESLPVWLTSLSGCLHTTWKSTLKQLSYFSIQGKSLSPTTWLPTTWLPLSTTLLAPTPTAWNLGVTLDSQLSLTTNITATTRSSRYMLHNIRRIRPLFTRKAAQVLVKALVISHRDYCNSLLAGLPAKAIRPLELFQNAAARLVFSLPKSTHTTLLLHSLTGGCPHPLQNIGSYVQCCERIGPSLHSGYGQALQPSTFTPLGSNQSTCDSVTSN